MNPITKTCPKCGRELPVSQFSRDKSRHDGYYRMCKECDMMYKAKFHHKQLARHYIGKLVRQKKMPPAKIFRCSVCGGSAAIYHHIAGYDGENRRNVIPVCRSCNAKPGIYEQLTFSV